ncbi:hypothetical protein, partial [Amnibacterium sp.]|uniref:hypothetical protein n=1 Tax=Amnibacterium sp. TaxID=1872496 RepID=UPI00262D8D04
MSTELDDLRRRLYAPDVTPAEVERYRALAGAARPEIEAGPGAGEGSPGLPQPASRPGPPPRRAALVA